MQEADDVSELLFARKDRWANEFNGRWFTHYPAEQLTEPDRTATLANEHPALFKAPGRTSSHDVQRGG